LTWSDNGKLAQIAVTPSGGGTAQQTSFVYDPDGNQLIRADPGATTLYLNDEELVLDTATGTVTGTRYYTLGAVTVATRTATGSGTDVAWLAGDSQGTQSVAIDAATLTVTRRWYDPYGNQRGKVPSAFPDGEKGFVGGTADAVTGLTNLGAREYQAGTGSFISPDPLLDAYNPQDLNAYAYSKDDPASLADPTGQKWVPYSGEIGSSGWHPMGDDALWNWYMSHIGIIIALPPNVSAKWTWLLPAAQFTNPQAKVDWAIYIWRWFTARGQRTDYYKTWARWTTSYRIHWAIYWWVITLASGELHYTSTSTYVQYSHGSPWSGRPHPNPRP
jgi:RHS repeat-associated protein